MASTVMPGTCGAGNRPPPKRAPVGEAAHVKVFSIDVDIETRIRLEDRTDTLVGYIVGRVPLSRL